MLFVCLQRPWSVDVEYETVSGELVRAALEADDARIFQHELDHLDGILYTDKLLPGSLAYADIIRQDESARIAIEEACGLTQ